MGLMKVLFGFHSGVLIGLIIIINKMLSILERELLWKYYFASRLVTRFTKPSVFPKAE